MNYKKISAIFSVMLIAVLITVYYTSVGYTSVSSNTAKKVVPSDSTITNPVYTCPMHPEVISDKPGQCPKCGMDLVLKTDNSGDNNMTMKDCMNNEKCKEMGCNMENCKGDASGCKSCGNMKDCPMMNSDKSKEHDHNSKDDDHKSDKHQHKSGCKKKGC